MKIIIVVLAVIFLLTAFAWYHGMFSRIVFRKADSRSMYIVYKPVRGDYRNSGAVMDEAYLFLKNGMNVPAKRGFGYYFDNPRETDTENLRAIAGCLVEIAPDKNKIEAAGFKTGEIPEGIAFTASFPYRSKISVLFSLLKVYPALQKKLEAENLKAMPVIEIYDIPEKKIRYVILLDFPVEKAVNEYYD